MDAAQFREAAHAVIEDIIAYFSALPDVRVTPTVAPGYLAPLLPRRAPELGEPAAALLEDVRTKIAPGLTHWQSPNFMAFFPAMTTFPSILGEMYSAAFTAPAFNWLCSPACTELETVVLDWVARMLGLPACFLSDGPSRGGGVLQGSASEAVLPVMVAAREARVRAILAAEDLLERADESPSRRLRREARAADVRGRLVALASEQAHSLAQKAANILGIRFRAVPAGRAAGFSMSRAALDAAVAECEAAGLDVFFVLATMGTTSTCAVDDLEGVAALRRERAGDAARAIWVHVDAAYAGAALCCEELREHARSRWLAELDSIDFNMHKWMLVNFDASCLFLRDRAPVTTAMSINPTYLQNPAAISGLVTDYRDWQVPLGRRFRALKVWFVLRTYGVAGVQRLVRRHVALGELFAGLVRGRPDLLELVAGPNFALTVIRCVVPGGESASMAAAVTESQRQTNGAHVDGKDEAEMNGFGTKRETGASDAANAVTKQVCELINARGQIFLTAALVDGIQVIRVVSANELADESHVRRAFEIIVATTEEVLAARTSGQASEKSGQNGDAR